MKKLLLLSVFFIFSINLFYAQTTVFLNPDKDNSIYAETTDASNGLGSLYAGTNNAGFPARALLHFDIAGSLPANATITQVILRLDLHKKGPAGGSQNYSLHVVANQDWGEGTSIAGTVAGGGGAGAPAIAPDATWDDAMFGTVTWGTAGGDYMMTPSATTGVGGVGPYAWFNTNMNVDAQNWYNSPASNFGWILKIDDEGPSGTASAWGSKDQGVSPVLEVSYTTPLSTDTPDVQDLLLYPNPASDFIKIGGVNGTVEYRVFNILGSVVIKGNVTSNETIQLNGLDAGLYLIEINSDQRTEVKRFLKE